MNPTEVPPRLQLVSRPCESRAQTRDEGQQSCTWRLVLALMQSPNTEPLTTQVCVDPSAA